MDHGKDHHGSHNVATQHGKKNYESADSKQHQAEENQAPRSGFQLGQVNINSKRKLTFLNTTQGIVERSRRPQDTEPIKPLNSRHLATPKTLKI